MEIRLKEVTNPADREVEGFAALLKANFADENLCLGTERIQGFVAETPTAARTFHLLVAVGEERVLGGTLFSCAAATGAGFSEYLVLSKEARGGGVSRQLAQRRREILDRSARQRGHAGSPGLLIEVENPWRMPQSYLEHERETAMDAVERWRYFHHMGYQKLDFDYHMPPLGPDQEPVTYLDMFFLPWSDQYRGSIPAEFLVQTLAPTWTAWSPEYGARGVEELRQQLGGKAVPLISIEAELLKMERRWAQ